MVEAIHNANQLALKGFNKIPMSANFIKSWFPEMKLKMMVLNIKIVLGFF